MFAIVLNKKRVTNTSNKLINYLGVFGLCCYCFYCNVTHYVFFDTLP